MKRVLSIVLTAALLIATFGMSAFAADATSGASESTTTTTKTPASTTSKTTSTKTTSSKTTTVKAAPVVISGDKYVVKAGDTLAKIAAAAKTTIDALAQHNSIKNVHHITVGQIIYIPKAADTAAATPAVSVSTATASDISALNARIADLEKQLQAAKSGQAGTATETRGQGIYEDIIATASVNLTKEADLAKSLSSSGTWITTLGGDLTCTNDLVWEGDVRKGGAEGALGRKLGIYYHSTPNIGGEQIFTLKAPNLIVKADKASVQYGTFDGNIKVEANDFALQYATVTGNVEFATQAQYDSATFNDVKINGKVIVAGAEKSATDKPQTVVSYAKYSDGSASGDMIRSAVTFKDGKPHDVLFDVLGPDYWIKEGVLTSSNQGNWGKVAYNKAGLYGMGGTGFMAAISADRPKETILRWDQQMAQLQTLYKDNGFDMSQIPLIQRDATHPSVIDFSLYDGGKWAEFVNAAAPGAIDATKLSGDARIEAFKADAITSVSVDVGKYLKAAQGIVDNFGK